MSDDGQFVAAPPELAARHAKRVEAEAQAKFPEEYARIGTATLFLLTAWNTDLPEVKKFGVVEYVLDEDYNVEGLAEPQEYLEQSDRLELGRLAATHASTFITSFPL